MNYCKVTFIIFYFIITNLLVSNYYAEDINDYLPYDTKIKICTRLAGIHMIRRIIATIICPWWYGISSSNQCLGTTWMKSGEISRRCDKRHVLHDFATIVSLTIWILFIFCLRILIISVNTILSELEIY